MLAMVPQSVLAVILLLPPGLNQGIPVFDCLTGVLQKECKRTLYLFRITVGTWLSGALQLGMWLSGVLQPGTAKCSPLLFVSGTK